MRARRAVLRWMLAASILLPSSLAAMDIERCARPASLDREAAVVINTSRVAGTSRRLPPTTRETVQVRVVLSAPGEYKRGKNIAVELVDAGGRSIGLAPQKPGDRTYLATVPPGPYTLKATPAEGSEEAGRKLYAPPRHLVLDQDINSIDVHLGLAGQSFMRIGNSLVPFAPSRFVAVVPPYGTAASDDLLKRIDVIARTQRAERLSELEAKASFAGRSIVLLKTDDDLVKARLVVALREALGGEFARVGMAIDVGKKSGRVLDNRFAFRFEAKVDDATREEVMQRNRLVRVKLFQRDKDLWLVAFPDDDYPSQFATINCLIEEGVLATAEPDLVQGWQVQGLLPAEWPDDPGYAAQRDALRRANHLNQKIREAWEMLYDSNRKLVGNSSIRVGLIDEVIDPNDEEVSCMVDGSPQIAMCWDPDRFVATNNGQCLTPANAQSHGMNMLGIIAACTNNKKGIAGIAPGIRVNTVTFHGPTGYAYYANSEYSNLLRWMGGMAEPCVGSEPVHDICHWPAVRSDVINNSYTIGTPEDWNDTKIPLPELVASAFETLVTQGRDGKGTVLVFAAGNWSPPLPTEIKAPFAADARTIGVSNCWFKGGQERLYQGENVRFASNFGDKIDVCADGEDALTIPAACGQQPCPSGGTSAATATVTGIVALMLSANPDLNWQEVRTLLRDSADKIDSGETDPVGKWVGGQSKWYGSGRVNAAAAVKAALDARPSPGQ